MWNHNNDRLQMKQESDSKQSHHMNWHFTRPLDIDQLESIKNPEKRSEPNTKKHSTGEMSVTTAFQHFKPTNFSGFARLSCSFRFSFYWQIGSHDEATKKVFLYANSDSLLLAIEHSFDAFPRLLLLRLLLSHFLALKRHQSSIEFNYRFFSLLIHFAYIHHDYQHHLKCWPNGMPFDENKKKTFRSSREALKNPNAAEWLRQHQQTWISNGTLGAQAIFSSLHLPARSAFEFKCRPQEPKVKAMMMMIEPNTFDPICSCVSSFLLLYWAIRVHSRSGHQASFASPPFRPPLTVPIHVSTRFIWISSSTDSRIECEKRDARFSQGKFHSSPSLNLQLRIALSVVELLWKFSRVEALSKSKHINYSSTCQAMPIHNKKPSPHKSPLRWEREISIRVHQVYTLDELWLVPMGLARSSTAILKWLSSSPCSWNLAKANGKLFSLLFLNFEDE